VRRLLVTASVVYSSSILVTLMKEALLPPKRRLLQEPHSVTSQKMPFRYFCLYCWPLFHFLFQTPFTSVITHFFLLPEYHCIEIMAAVHAYCGTERGTAVSSVRGQGLDTCACLNVFTAVTMKNGVFWDIKTQFVLHRRHITSPLQNAASQCYVRFEVSTAVTLKNAVFWDGTPCGSCKNRRFGEI
jgi:hypothetical protein